MLTCFWYDLKLQQFFKTKHKICSLSKKSYLFKFDCKQAYDILGQLYKYNK
jgi:hypothetical protein